MSDVKVLCYSCHRPIHIDHLAGITNVGGKEAWFCDNIYCLVEFTEVTGSWKNRGLGKHVGQKKEMSVKTSG
jgi:hypothetical protein